MAERPDYAGLIAGHAHVIDMINSGVSGLAPLNRLLEITQDAIGAVGVSYLVTFPTFGRIVAASGVSSWAVGRPIPATDPIATLMLTGDRGVHTWLRDLPGPTSASLQARGLTRLIGARAELAGATIGSLQAYFVDPPPEPGEPDASDDPDLEGIMRYVSTCAAQIHRDTSRPRPRRSAVSTDEESEGLAVVDATGLVRMWNPVAAQITGLAEEHVLGDKLPIPMPANGAILNHLLPGGRWIKIGQSSLPESDGARLVSIIGGTSRVGMPDSKLFVAVTSHELRTPVTVIKGYADTLNTHWEQLTEPVRRQMVIVIRQRADELAGLVDRLLTAASEPPAADGSTRPAHFDLGAALRQSVAELRADLRERIQIDLPPDLPPVFGDRTSIGTILTELVTNADKYSGGSAVELTAGTDELSVFFRVSDHGVGVQPQHVERAFEPFWQGDSGDRRRYPGVGLGLYLVRRIVERQDGWVSLRPRVGGGTVAEVRLPRPATVEPAGGPASGPGVREG